MKIFGSAAFQLQVNKALNILRDQDTNYDVLASHIVSITEIADSSFRAEITAEGNIEISTNVAFWPNTPANSQTNILATYISHEMIHAYLSSCHSVDWNRAKGEIEAMRYQLCVADMLKVPSVYVEHPESTLGVPVSSAGSVYSTGGTPLRNIPVSATPTGHPLIPIVIV